MIDLTDYERGRRYHGKYREALKQLQKRFARILAAHIVHGQRAVIMFEGWDSAGKGGIIQRLTGRGDQHHYQVWPIAAPTPQEKKRDFLWRFRKGMPAPG